MLNNNQKYWQRFYKAKKLNSYIDFPSQFSIFTLSKKKNENILFEFGCGNGRDASYMSRFYKKTFAFDLSKNAIQMNKKKYKNLKSLFFNVCDISKYFDTNFYKKFNKKVVYARFFLHSLTDDEINFFISLTSKLMKKDEKIYLEYRTHLDKNKKKFFKKHYRNFLNPNKIIKLYSKKKFKNIYSVSGHGLAVFNNEDPHVARQIFIKK